MFLATSLFFIVFVNFDHFWTTIPLNLKFKKKREKKSVGGKNEERRERKEVRALYISQKSIRSKNKKEKRDKGREEIVITAARRRLASLSPSLPLTIASHLSCHRYRERKEQKRSRTCHRRRTSRHHRTCRRCRLQQSPEGNFSNSSCV